MRESAEHQLQNDTALSYTDKSDISCWFRSASVTGNSIEQKPVNHPRPTIEVICPDLQRIQKRIILVH